MPIVFRGEGVGRVRVVLAIGAALLCFSAADGAIGATGVPVERVADQAPQAPPARVASGADALDRALRRGAITRPRYALARARSLFEIGRVRRTYGAVRAPGPQDATRVLQRLELSLGDLGHRARRRASAILARPTDGAKDQFGDGYTVPAEVQCLEKQTPSLESRQLCVHWVESTADAPPLTDTTPANGIPDQVDRTIATLGEVWDEEIGAMDFRAPLQDSGPGKGQGPNNGLDLYLADVGADRLFGYCAADPKKKKRRGRPPKPRLRAPGYCVVDDDFAAAQYEPPSPSGLPALRVTVAHEFFHAVQFAYEYSGKDQWLKEGTAAWIEDELYDSIDANRLYLPESAVAQPEIPLDHAGLATDAQDYEYGAWVFWRFLSEYVGADTIREVLEATAPTSNSDRSAVAALNQVVSGLTSTPDCILCDPASFREAFAEFALWNLFYDDPFFYEEGPDWFAVLHEVLPPYDALYLMDAEYAFTGERSIRLDGLSQGHLTFRVDPGLAPDSQLNVTSLGASFDGALEVTALVEFVGATDLAAYDMGGGNQGLGFPAAEAVTLVYSNAAAGPDDEAYEYSAELVPGP